MYAAKFVTVFTHRSAKMRFTISIVIRLDGKVLFIEDLQWTNQMLNPLGYASNAGKTDKNARHKRQGRNATQQPLLKCVAKLCLIACAYSEKNYDQLSLPFLCLNLNHSQTHRIKNVMDYQKKCKAGLIDQS